MGRGFGLSPFFGLGGLMPVICRRARLGGRGHESGLGRAELRFHP